jgi:uncharacterized protein
VFRIVLSLSFVLLAALAAAVDTVHLPMRDGVTLATDIHLPDDSETRYPVILIRTTYGRAGAGTEGLVRDFTSQGFAVVLQDTRGRGGSGGVDWAFADDGWGERQDGADTVAWIRSEPWCNGKVGTWGGSALGITQVMLAGATPDIDCQFIVVAASNFYDQLAYQGGVFRKSLCEGWLAAQQSRHVLGSWYEHTTYDAFWEKHNANDRARQIQSPAVHVGGWFDIFQKGTLENFLTRQENGGPGAKGHQILVMGPWIHGVRRNIGDLEFPANFNFPTGDLQQRLYAHYLLGEANGIESEARVHYYVMGDTRNPKAPGNEWRTAETWPPYAIDATRFYLGPRGRLTGTGSTKESRFTYTFDPHNPVPTHGGANLLLPAGPYDQRGLAQREDVLTFSTPKLRKAVEISGPVSVELYVSTNAVDTDFTAKLVDIYPDGSEILIADGIQRVRFRGGFREEAFLPPGEIGRLTIDLWHTSLIFDQGHRIGVHISSSNYPRFEVNPNTGEDRPTANPMFVAENTVHAGGAYPSALILPVRAD